MKTKIWTALIAIYLVWGSTYLAIHFAVETIPPFLQAGIRFLISGAILIFWRRAMGDDLPTRSQWRSVAIVGILLLLGGNGMVSFGEQYVPSGIAALIVGTIPIWLVLIEALRPGGVKPTWQAIVGLLTGLVGIYLLIGPSSFGGSLQFNAVGIAALLAAAVLWSIGSIYSRTADVPSSTLMMTGGEMITGSMALLVVSAATGEWQTFDLSQVALHSWLGLLYLILIGSLVGFVSYGWLLRNAPVSLVATYPYVNPVVAVFLGNLLAQEPLTSRTLLAAGIIIGSVVFINSARQPKVRKEAQEVIVGD